MESLSHWIGITATVAFAVTAVLAVSPKGIDLFGATVMGIITAIGGGTVRDIIMDQPVFWAADLTYIWVALGASMENMVRNFLQQRDAAGKTAMAVRFGEHRRSRHPGRFGNLCRSGHQPGPLIEYSGHIVW